MKIFPVFQKKDFTFYVVLIFCVCAFFIPLLYCLTTENIWEDFFITFKFSENLCRGNGLVYAPGVKVHGFTSPLGTLLPALCCLLSGSSSYQSAIWLFRLLFCIPVFAAGGILLIKVFSEKKRTATVFIALLYLFETKSVMFSVNGMETAFMLFFISWTVYLLQRDITKTWLNCGIAWAGLMWTRPDSCIYVAVFATAALIFNEFSRKIIAVSILKAFCITALLYFPWFIWAWTYYGFPIPHTVLAKKALFSQSENLDFFRCFLRNLPRRLAYVFAPPYPHFRELPFPVTVFSYFSGFFCFIYWMIPYLKDKFGKMMSFIFFLASIYLTLIPYAYPWYFPPLAVLGLIVIVRVSVAVLEKENIPFKILRCLPAMILTIMIPIFLLTSYQYKIQQREVEDGNRKQIGLWLRNNIGKDDRIYLECTGYIGYFSGGKMLDFPGLVSPEVVRLMREENLNFITLVEKLKPEWTVLRPSEYNSIYHRLEYFRDNYMLVAVFDASGRINSYRYIPGRGALLFDSVFFIFRKKEK